MSEEMAIQAYRVVNHDKLGLWSPHGLHKYLNRDLYFMTRVPFAVKDAKFTSCPKLVRESVRGYTYSIKGADIHDIAVISQDPRVDYVMDEQSYSYQNSIAPEKMPSFTPSSDLVTQFALATYGNTRMAVIANKVVHFLSGQSLGDEAASECLAGAAQKGFARTLSEIYRDAKFNAPMIWQQAHMLKFNQNVLVCLPEFHQKAEGSKGDIAAQLASDWMDALSGCSHKFITRIGDGELHIISDPRFGFLLQCQDLA